jgi:hypothetical protein
MTEYQPRVIRSKKGGAQAWGVSSELRPEWSERGFIVQLVTEVLLPARDQSVAVVRKYTQAWKVCRLKGRMQTVGQGKSAITVGVSDLRVPGQRWYRFKAFFVAGAAENFDWEKSKRGAAWSTGHVLQPNQGQKVLCRLVRAKWDRARLPLFFGAAFVTTVPGSMGPLEMGKNALPVTECTRSGRQVKKEAAPNETQGADLLRAAGLGAANPRRSKLHRVKDEPGHAAPVIKGEDGTERFGEVIGDLLGRKLTGAMSSRRGDAMSACSGCLQSVPTADALVCCFSEKAIVFPEADPGGNCGTVLCVKCFNAGIDEEQYPDWRDEPQSLLTVAHARLIYNFVCTQCRYDICCSRVVEPRADCQYKYLISLITQYLVDLYSHLAKNTVASYGQSINVYLDFFAAAPDLDPDLVFGAVDVDLVGVANCTMLGMLMLHRANEGLIFNGIRGLRSAVWKCWSTRSDAPPTDRPEFKNFMKGLCERMGDEASSKWAMPVEVMQALVAMATEEANQALLVGETDRERELRTKAMYYLVCFLIWPRPGEHRE